MKTLTFGFMLDSNSSLLCESLVLDLFIHHSLLQMRILPLLALGMSRLHFFAPESDV